MLDSHSLYQHDGLLLVVFALPPFVLARFPEKGRATITSVVVHGIRRQMNREHSVKVRVLFLLTFIRGFDIMEFKENEHPRDSDGKFTKGGNSDTAELDELKRIYNSDGGNLNSFDDEDDSLFSYPTVRLPEKEYAMVMHELATNLTKEEHSFPTAIRHIRNYTYRVQILSFGNYRVIGKSPIKSKRRRREK